MSQHVGARVSDELADALEEAAREAGTSKSELIRHYLIDGVLESYADLPEYVRREMRRERLKRRNRLTWQKVHFPSNVADRFRKAFEQGDLDGDLNPGAVEDLREIHVEDAELLFEDDPERREAAVEFVHALAEHAADATDTSEFDRLDPEEMFQRYAGVEEADARAEADMDALIVAAEERLRKGATDEDALADALAKQHNVTEDMAREAVTEAVQSAASNGGVTT